MSFPTESDPVSRLTASARKRINTLVAVLGGRIQSEARSTREGVARDVATLNWPVARSLSAPMRVRNPVWQDFRQTCARLWSSVQLFLGLVVSAWRKRRESAVPETRKFDFAAAREPTLGYLPDPVGADDVIAIGDDANVDVSESEPRVERWSLGLLRSLEWKRFELVATEYFRMCGFHATMHSHDARRLADITLFAPADCNTPVCLVQCRHWEGPVGIAPLQKLGASMLRQDIARGVFVTSSTFDDQALAFARACQIFVIDGVSLLENIGGRPPAQQARLLEVATSGDFLTPTCLYCGDQSNGAAQESLDACCRPIGHAAPTAIAQC